QADPLFVVSGTPEDELRDIVRARGLAPRFRGVYGAPRGKTTLLQAVADEIGAAPAELVFVGDSAHDQAAALEAGASFVGRSAFSDEGAFGDAIMCVRNLAELERRWPEILATAAVPNAR